MGLGHTLYALDIDQRFALPRRSIEKVAAALSGLGAEAIFGVWLQRFERTLNFSFRGLAIGANHIIPARTTTRLILLLPASQKSVYNYQFGPKYLSQLAPSGIAPPTLGIIPFWKLNLFLL